MRMLVLAAAAAACLFAGAAHAQDCGDPGSATAQPLQAKDVVIPGVEISIMLGLEPGSFPLKDIKAEKSPCKRADFQVGGVTWTLFGGKESQPARWATAGGKTDRVAFLAFMPWPADAAAWSEKRKADPRAEAAFERMAVVLVIAEGSQRKLYLVYDDVPDDARLIQLMAAALSGEVKPFGTYDVKKHSLV